MFRELRATQRRQIVDAATAVFAACGYHEASMEEIAELAGLSKPTLYKSFSSKLDLYLVVLHTAWDRLVRGVSEALCWAGGLASTQTTPATAIAAAYFDFVDDHPQYSAVLFDAPGVEEPSVQWTTQRGRTRCVDAVFTAIASQTTWEPQRSRLLAVGLVGAAQTCAQEWVATGRPIPKQEAVEATTWLCWRGLSGMRPERAAPPAPPVSGSADTANDPQNKTCRMMHVGGLTPISAWKALRAGNDRFVEGRLHHPGQGAADRAELAAGQAPSAILFGCGDSRVAAEIIFDQGLGDMFVVRTAGHVIDASVLGSIEYGVAVLNVPLIVVLGHDRCGAVRTTLDALDTGVVPGGFIRSVVERVTPSILLGRREGLDSVDDLETRHVAETADLMRERSQIIADRIAAGELAIACVTYTLADGKARLNRVLGKI